MKGLRKYKHLNFLLVGFELMGRAMLDFDYKNIPTLWVISWKLIYG